MHDFAVLSTSLIPSYRLTDFTSHYVLTVNSLTAYLYSPTWSLIDFFCFLPDLFINSLFVSLIDSFTA